MNPIFTAIRQDPVGYLGTKTLSGFWHFVQGYWALCSEEGTLFDLQFDGHGFHKFVCAKFHLLSHAASTSSSLIITSYSANDSEAFDRYFDLLQEYLSGAPPHLPERINGRVIRTFIERMKAIRERPAMFLGWRSFYALKFYLRGYERARADLPVSTDAERELMSEFCRWVEREKNYGDPRPWFKIIECWGWTDPGSFKLFFAFLDGYVKEIGRPDLFKVEIERGVD
ncbi:hypothetical protein Acid345_2145 [Candidatus Koribacter versatilis Ellin345]|uniref:Uncharacterized protein n=1 Tax=Koribacter versatilis (strain Ellin345) TaxID=204669 RepID=Q1IPQ4_KORVE|nr:hypothetical protein [Candidatus Koribacter versatilis]ABF41146.1 hypothetical protein Acid345_2145 [Candidatus Koribacter versatilis Ellin345]